MSLLHVMPSASAGGSMQVALRDVKSNDEVLAFRDDLSCGPIDSDDASSRAKWWAPWYDPEDTQRELRLFWDVLERTKHEIVLWFSRESALEFSFFYQCATRLGARPYRVVELGGSPGTLDDPARRNAVLETVSTRQPEQLRALIALQSPPTNAVIERTAARWSELRQENAPFRVVTSKGLVSTPVDHFDAALLAEVTRAPRGVRSIIGKAMSQHPYQVGSMMLLSRLAALVGEGRLAVHGDAADLWSAAVALVH
jgi:hypothetical protein